MHSVRVSSQLLVSVLFIAVPTDTEKLQIFPTLVNITQALILSLICTHEHSSLYTPQACAYKPGKALMPVV